MRPDEIDALLQATFADGKMTRQERDRLLEVLRDLPAPDAALPRLRSRAFEITRSAVAEPRAREALDWLEDLVKVTARAMASASDDAAAETVAWFSPGEDCRRAVIGQLDRARQSADVCVFTITDDRIADAIIEAAKRGVRVRVITDNDKSADEGSDIARIEESGVPVRVDRTEFHMHHKFAIFDGSRLLNGSYNWTRSAAAVNEENLVLHTDQSLLAAFMRQFETLWKALG